MKRCPECRRDYFDDTLLYCLDDGASLLEGPASSSESPTVAKISSESPTIKIHTTNGVVGEDRPKTSLKTYPQDEGGNVTSVKALILAKYGKNEEAEAMIERAIEVGKGFGHFHHTAYNIASAYAIMNKPDEAMATLVSLNSCQKERSKRKSSGRWQVVNAHSDSWFMRPGWASGHPCTWQKYRLLV